MRYIMNVLFVILMALVLGACNGNGVNTDTSDTNDTGSTTPDGWATYTPTLSYGDGDGANEQVYVSSSDDTWDTTSGVSMELPAPESYIVRFGNAQEASSSDGLAVITDPEGDQWIHPEVELKLKDGDAVEDEILLNRYLRMQNASCELIDYIWVNDQWSAPETHTYDQVQVEVLEGQELWFEEDTGYELMNFLVYQLEGQDLIFHGNTLVPEGPHSDEVTVEEFRFTQPEGPLYLVTVHEDFRKAVLTCR